MSTPGHVLKVLTAQSPAGSIPRMQATTNLKAAKAEVIILVNAQNFASTMKFSETSVAGIESLTQPEMMTQ